MLEHYQDNLKQNRLFGYIDDMRIRSVAWLVVISWLGYSAWSVASPGPFPFDASPIHSIHVATNGSNVTGNGTLGNPYRTVQRAAQSAAPGSEIIIHPGTYSGGDYIYDLQGNSNLPIWVRGASPTNRPLFHGGSEGFHFTRARYLLIQDIEVASATANGINCDDGGQYTNEHASGFLVFSNLFIRDIGAAGNQDGLKLSGIRDFYIYNLEIARCGGAGSGSGIDMVGCHRGLIEGGSFYDLSGNAIQIKGGSSDVEIRQCIISNAGHRGVNIGGSTGFEFFRPPLSTNTPAFEAANVRLYANIIIGSTASVAFVGCVDSVVANNTIINPTRWVFRILQETTSASGYTFLACASNRFDNNIVHYNHAVLNQYVNIGPDTLPTTFWVRNNLWYAHNNPAAPPHALPGHTTNNIFGLPPGFANADMGNYRIILPGAAVTNGAGQVMVRDFDGVEYLQPPTIGAFEVSGDSDSDGLPDYWELKHFASIFPGAEGDEDADGMTNWEEWVSDTDPTDATSRLGILDIKIVEGAVHVRWQGGLSANQYVETQSGYQSDWVARFTNHPHTSITNAIIIENPDTEEIVRIRARR